MLGGVWEQEVVRFALGADLEIDQSLVFLGLATNTDEVEGLEKF